MIFRHKVILSPGPKVLTKPSLLLESRQNARLEADALYTFASLGAGYFIVAAAGAGLSDCGPRTVVAQVILLVLPSSSAGGAVRQR